MQEIGVPGSLRQVADTDLLCLLKNELDSGEAEAIALAKEINAKLILLDERAARKIAKSLRLIFSGRQISYQPVDKINDCP